MNSLAVKMLTALVSSISNSQVFFLNKCEQLLQMQNLLTFFSKNISVYAIFNDQSFNGTFTDIVSFEQLGPDEYISLNRPPAVIIFPLIGLQL